MSMFCYFTEFSHHNNVRGDKREGVSSIIGSDLPVVMADVDVESE